MTSAVAILLNPPVAACSLRWRRCQGRFASLAAIEQVRDALMVIDGLTADAEFDPLRLHSSNLRREMSDYRRRADHLWCAQRNQQQGITQLRIDGR